MLRRLLLSLSRNPVVEHAVATAPLSRQVVARFVAGRTADDAVRVGSRLQADGLQVSFDHLGEDTTDAGLADASTKAYAELLGRLSDAGLARGADVSVKLSALGQRLDPSMATDNAHVVAAAANEVGATMTIDMEDHTTTDATLSALAQVRRTHPGTGAVIQSYLHRSVDDCRALATAGSRVRLCKGAYKEPPAVAFQRPRDVDASYVRCLRVLMAGPGYPMVATHDPRLVAVAGELAARAGRDAGSFEYQMLYGVRPDEQRRLASAGAKVRVYVPYGDQWYGYLMRRLAERPANLTFFLRAVASTR